MNEKKSKLKIIKRKVRRSTLFFLAFLLMANAFAWFIYSNKISNNITTGVRSWKVTFEQDGVDLEDMVEFKIDSIYPGMKNYEDSIEITNNGEMTAYISYEIQSVKIMDEYYTLKDYTSDQMINLLARTYPFKISFSNNNAEIAVDQTGKFSVNVFWPYESGNDELDTSWGKKSYEYKEKNGDAPQIEIVVKIKASQNKGN